MAKNLQCPKCDRTFYMPAHLARHMSSMHASAAAKAAKKRGKKRRKKGGWPKGKKRTVARGAKRGPGRMIAGVRVSSLSLDQLSDLITAARDEARRKISDLERSLG